MYGFRRGKFYYFTEELEREIDDIGYWSNFERNLAFLSSLWVENSLMDDLGLEYPEAVDLEIQHSDLSETIKDTLKDWINSKVDKKKNFKIIKKYIGNNRVIFLPEDSFISFNYTHTLEEVYNISSSNVLHIHGEANSASELIIGHGNYEILQELTDKILILDVDDYDQPTRNRKIEYKFEKEVLHNLYKPIETCKGQLHFFVNKIKKPDFIDFTLIRKYSQQLITNADRQVCNQSGVYCKKRYTLFLCPVTQ